MLLTTILAGVLVLPAIGNRKSTPCPAPPQKSNRFEDLSVDEVTKVCEKYPELSELIKLKKSGCTRPTVAFNITNGQHNPGRVGEVIQRLQDMGFHIRYIYPVGFFHIQIIVNYCILPEAPPLPFLPAPA